MSGGFGIMRRLSEQALRVAVIVDQREVITRYEVV